jgi:hypothetical protein
MNPDESAGSTLFAASAPAGALVAYVQSINPAAIGPDVERVGARRESSTVRGRRSYAIR